MGDWQVYIILCSDGTFYTGTTKDVERRFAEHASGRGARYFRGRSPEKVVYVEGGHTQGSSLVREAGIRKLGRKGKLRLASSMKAGSGGSKA